MKNRCLYCYKELGSGSNYHPACAHKLFGIRREPVMEYSRDNIEELALQVLESNTSITGVQPKISLDINRGGKNEPDKLTIVGLWGNYILKPQSTVYRSMPELEDLTMKMAEASGISTACHGLIRMSDGELAYITRRMDRGAKGEKYSMLDLCQLTNRLTEHKYMGTYSQLAETIRKYSSASMLDVQLFWQIVVFSWITGNSDMHCKNFSLLEKPGVGYRLSPAYDLLAVLLTGINDEDELALPLKGTYVEGNGPLKSFNRNAFIEAMTESGVSPDYAAKIIDKLTDCRDSWYELIEMSFLTDSLKAAYKALIGERLRRLALE